MIIFDDISENIIKGTWNRKWFKCLRFFYLLLKHRSKGDIFNRFYLEKSTEQIYSSRTCKKVQQFLKSKVSIFFKNLYIANIEYIIFKIFAISLIKLSPSAGTINFWILVISPSTFLENGFKRWLYVT